MEYIINFLDALTSPFVAQFGLIGAMCVFIGFIAVFGLGFALCMPSEKQNPNKRFKA